MMKETVDVTGKVMSVAPAEDEIPKNLLSDEFYEELAFPHLYPTGKNALTAERPVRLHPRRYFNQRLLDCDGRFARSVEYLLSSQYATEYKQVHSDINHFIFRRGSGRLFQGKEINAGLVRDEGNLNQILRADKAYKILKNIRGSPGYYQSLFYDILAMIRQKNIPSMFLTLSAADTRWPDVIQTIANQYGTILSDEDVNNLSFTERSDWLRCNPVTAARHFQYRVDLFFRDVLLSNAHPLGEITDYTMRVEFQNRGSPHIHALLWVKDAPRLNEQTDEEVCMFIDKYITCALPDDDDLLDLVQNLQIHSHSAYCRKKGHCRFKFPKPPSARTVIAREPVSVEEIAKKQGAKDVLSCVQDVLTSDETPLDITLEQLCDMAGKSVVEYMDALSLSEKGSNIVLQRSPSELNVNGYNPTLLKAWQANLDLQYILDAYACVMYVASYVTKNESGMGELLKQACKESRDPDVRSTLRKVGSVFLNNRELSAQEAAYRILSMPLKRSSRKVVFVNTDPKETRVAVLKDKAQLDKLEDDDPDVFQRSLIDRYVSRPDTIENVCYAEFSANYATRNNENEDDDDSVPNVLEEQEPDTPQGLPARIKLKDGRGTMYKRRKTAVIRFRKYNAENDTANFYRSKLMLYIPWRDEDRDLISDYDSYESHFNAVSRLIYENEEKYTHNAELIEHAMDENAENGPPQHMWELLAPGTEHENLQAQHEDLEVERAIEQEDLDANAAMFQRPLAENASDIVARYDIEENQQMLSPEEYRSMMRSLNKKQREIVLYHRKWCKYAVGCLKQNMKPAPYRIFLSGPGGVGKSHVIRLIHSDTKRFFSLSRQFKPTDILTLLTAPTGVAAFNINGMTIHSALLLRTSKYGHNGEPLAFDKLNTLRSKLENLQLLIIDEISMVGSDMLLNIHRRLGEIMDCADPSRLFGNISILAVGDLYQLPPVCQSRIYDPVRNPYANLSGSLWKDFFALHELDQVMRQRDDQDFAELLCRLRIGKHNDNDLATLCSRQIDESCSDYPYNALHVFAYNCDVDNWNQKRLYATEPNPNKRVKIPAIDDKKDSTRLLDLEHVGKMSKRSETGGLHSILEIAIGARVMLVYNVDTSDGLVNGVIGNVAGIERGNDGKVITVLVKFDNAEIGKKAISSGQWRQKYPSAVPIMRHESKFEKSGKKGAQVSRVQFPLTLAWGVTIHKCQGLTMDKIVVCMKGANKFGNGQAYVALSRVRSLQGLYITDFDKRGIKTDSRVVTEMNEMQKLSLSRDNQANAFSLAVGYLNIHYMMVKMRDLKSDNEKCVYTGLDVVCFSETYLTRNDCIDQFLDEHGYQAFRSDKSTTVDGSSRHGLVICASSELQPREIHPIPFNLVKFEYKAIVTTTEHGRLIVVAVYKSPSLSCKEFAQNLESLLISLPEVIPTVILGDFNDNILDGNETVLTRLMCRYRFNQLITDPTTDCGSLLDHIYFNRETFYGNEVHASVRDIYYSDHDLISWTVSL